MPFGFGRGKRRRYGGKGRGFPGRKGLGIGPDNNCICPNCGFILPRQRALPCFQTRCPRCSSSMTRQFHLENNNQE